MINIKHFTMWRRVPQTIEVPDNIKLPPNEYTIYSLCCGNAQVLSEKDLKAKLLVKDLNSLAICPKCDKVNLPNHVQWHYILQGLPLEIRLLYWNGN